MKLYVGLLICVFSQCCLCQDKCLNNQKVNLIAKTFHVSGIPYTKNAVDSSTPIMMTFLVYGKPNVKKIKFQLNGGPIDVDNDNRPPVYYLINDIGPLNVTVVITSPKTHFIGLWKMIIKNTDDSVSTQTCEVTSPPLAYRFDETLRATEGYELSAVCRGASLPKPTQIQWHRAVVDQNKNVKLEKVDPAPTHHEIPGDTLFFKAVHKKDAGIYICNATSGAQMDSVVAEVKVKSRLAALWPFIGILLELIILMITIIIYERHKACKEKKAAENDPLLSVHAAGDAKGSPSRSENVLV